MADTNTYDLFQKVEKWTTKENFNKLDPRTIETGTEYNLTGAIEESDLDVDLQTKINEVNGKLTKPANPTADSAVTMLADGTVGTKPLSEIGGGGGKLYMHKVSFNFDTNDPYHLNIEIPTNTNEDITVDFLRNYITGYSTVSYDGALGIGAVTLNCTPDYIHISGAVFGGSGATGVDINHRNANGLVISVQTLIEL